MKKLFMLFVILGTLAMSQVPSQMFTRHKTKEFKANTSWSNALVDGIGQTYVQYRFSGLATTDSLYISWYVQDTSAGKRITVGASDSLTWLSLPVFTTRDSLWIRTKSDDSAWVRLRIFK